MNDKAAAPRDIANALIDLVKIHPVCIFGTTHQDRTAMYLRSLVGYLARNITGWSCEKITQDLNWVSRHTIKACVSRWVEVKHCHREATMRIIGVTYTPQMLEDGILNTLREKGFYIPDVFDYDPFVNPEFQSRQPVPWLD